jgi:hypothetical protein
VTATTGGRRRAADKPAFWVDGNIHAAELTASTACLYYLHTLEEGYGKDEAITRLLDTRSALHLPAHQSRRRGMGARRQAEVHPLVDAPLSVRRGPGGRPQRRGRRRRRAASCRCASADPNGAYKAHPADSRLVTPREPAEYGGEYWRVIPRARWSTTTASRSA